MSNNLNEVLMDNNQRMKNMDNSLGNTVGDVKEINNVMMDTNVMLVDQTQKFKQMQENNKDLHSGYKKADRVLVRIKWKQILYKGLLFLLIILLTLTDILLLFYKIFK